MKRIAIAAAFGLAVAANSFGFGGQEVATASAESAAEYCASPVDINTPEYVNFCCELYNTGRLERIPVIVNRWDARCRP
ncbi:hypothetical protein OHA40_03110 [Nocardia sp. NBC_00508]|uniref:hypothetical protein n=1 Tax=Nocardia sp. NBC_00508 TaxID=2975992 RepID=UPI002E81D525|nr:hypothetical protein [Nocardia sp. NBC_00508]WUD67166.1 hypothetical protein OHA40_03110 [Nocardia sp. NBC_00508]